MKNKKKKKKRARRLFAINGKKKVFDFDIEIFRETKKKTQQKKNGKYEVG